VPFLKYLYNPTSIHAPHHDGYALAEAVRAGFLDHVTEVPLSWAAREGYDALVKQLLAQDNIDVNLMDRHGQTPLFYAALRGREAVVKLLLAQNNIDVNLGDRDGGTPIFVCSRKRARGSGEAVAGTGQR